MGKTGDFEGSLKTLGAFKIPGPDNLTPYKLHTNIYTNFFYVEQTHVNKSFKSLSFLTNYFMLQRSSMIKNEFNNVNRKIKSRLNYFNEWSKIKEKSLNNL